MHNMHAYRIAKNGPSRELKGRELATVTTLSKKGKCHICKKPGHWAQGCYSRKRSMKETNKTTRKRCSIALNTSARYMITQNAAVSRTATTRTTTAEKGTANIKRK